MSKNFHQDYADSVKHFCQSLPPELNITTQEVDAYFRACALFLWSGSDKRGGDLYGISQIYSDRPVQFTSSQFDKAIDYYRNHPGTPWASRNFSSGWLTTTPVKAPASAAPLLRFRKIF